MIPVTQTSLITRSALPEVFDLQADIKAEFGRLIHAAIINRTFRQKLLSDPLSSIEAGYCGEKFHFPPEIKERIQLIHAETLESLSFQLLQTIKIPYIAESAVIHYQ